ncbi:MAG: type II secretion system protein [Gemmatimonadales bacterium]
MRHTTRMTDERGFTLVEALVALTISGIIATALVSLLTAQTRFYNRTDDQMWAEQTAQATFDLFSAEVRGAGAGDLLAAEADSVTFRFDVLRAVVCDAPSSDEATVYVYERTTNANLTGSFVGIAASGPYEETFEYADDWNPTPAASGAGPKATCLLAGAPATGASSDYLTLDGWSSNFPSDAPDVGGLVRGYGKVTYKLAASTFFESRTALWRGTQEIVGPFENDAAFSYVMEDGSVESSVSSSDFDEVVAVRMTATTVGAGANRYDVTRPVDFEVPFRN